jgi:hypothetical protein
MIFSDPGSNNSNRRGEKICWPTNMTKLTIILFSDRYRKIFDPIHKNYCTFCPKDSPSSQKYGFGIQDPEKNIFWSPGVKVTGSEKPL